MNFCYRISGMIRLKFNLFMAFSWALAALIVFCPAAHALQAIRFEHNPDRWTITTYRSTYQVIITEDKNLTPGFFGPLSGERLYDDPEYRNSKKVGTFRREIPYRGGFVEMTPALEVVFPDGNRELELEFVNYEIVESDGCPCLRLDMRDTYYDFTVSEYIGVIPELDIYRKWLVLKNTGSGNILLERAYSGSVVLPTGSYRDMSCGGARSG